MMSVVAGIVVAAGIAACSSFSSFDYPSVGIVVASRVVVVVVFSVHIHTAAVDPVDHRADPDITNAHARTSDRWGEYRPWRSDIERVGGVCVGVGAVCGLWCCCLLLFSLSLLVFVGYVFLGRSDDHTTGSRAGHTPTHTQPHSHSHPYTPTQMSTPYGEYLPTSLSMPTTIPMSFCGAVSASTLFVLSLGGKHTHRWPKSFCLSRTHSFSDPIGDRPRFTFSGWDQTPSLRRCPFPSEAIVTAPCHSESQATRIDHRHHTTRNKFIHHTVTQTLRQRPHTAQSRRRQQREEMRDTYAHEEGDENAYEFTSSQQSHSHSHSQPQSPPRRTPGFAAFDMDAIDRANAWKQAPTQPNNIDNPYAAAPSTVQPTNKKKKQQRPASAAARYHPLSYAVLRPELMKSARSSIAPFECVSTRPQWTFSSPPSVYPYRFERKPDYLLPHMSQSLATTRSTKTVIPEAYQIRRDAWRQAH